MEKRIQSVKIKTEWEKKKQKELKKQKKEQQALERELTQTQVNIAFFYYVLKVFSLLQKTKKFKTGVELMKIGNVEKSLKRKKQKCGCCLMTILPKNYAPSIEICILYFSTFYIFLYQIKINKHDLIGLIFWIEFEE